MLNGNFSLHWVSFHGLVTGCALAIFLLASRTLRQRRHTSASIAWFISLALMPYISLPIYLLVGNRKLARPLPAQHACPLALEELPRDHSAQQMRILARSLRLPDASTYDQFDLHRDGSQALASLLSVIDQARTSLDICTFLLGDDFLGQTVMSHLVASAQKGVVVRLMIDGVGRYLGGHLNLDALQTAGVVVALFSPPSRFLISGGVNLRNHRKMAVADDDRVWMGGRNLAAEYFEGTAGATSIRAAAPWIDLTFELRGPIARQAKHQFCKDWAFAVSGRAVEFAKYVEQKATPVMSNVQLVPSGPDQSDDTVYALLISSLFAAQTRIIAVSPYYVPDPALQMALTLAARRGVQVDLLLPRKSNHSMADIARAAPLRELVSCGARVWLHPQMVHAKAVVVDHEFALVGSANLDERSLFLNYELMAGFYEPGAVEQVAGWILASSQQASLYKPHHPGIFREMGEGVVRSLAFQL